VTRAWAHARWELGILLRNGEQVLLTLLIPLGLLLLTRSFTPVVATSVLAAMFTSLAIGTGFERRSGALRFLGVTPLRRWELMLGKLVASLIILLISLALAGILGAALGCMPQWSPGQWCLAVVLTVLGSCAAAAWALTLAGNVRAEAVLAIANGIFIALVIAALLLPGSLSDGWATASLVIPSVALAHGLSDPNWPSVGVLLVWSAVGIGVVSRHFSWDD
jgi:ABC-2 type transport system permease protein